MQMQMNALNQLPSFHIFSSLLPIPSKFRAALDSMYEAEPNFLLRPCADRPLLSDFHITLTSISSDFLTTHLTVLEELNPGFIPDY